MAADMLVKIDQSMDKSISSHYKWWRLSIPAKGCYMEAKKGVEVDAEYS